MVSLGEEEENKSGEEAAALKDETAAQPWAQRAAHEKAPQADPVRGLSSTGGTVHIIGWRCCQLDEEGYLMQTFTLKSNCCRVEQIHVLIVSRMLEELQWIIRNNLQLHSCVKHICVSLWDCCVSTCDTRLKHAHNLNTNRDSCVPTARCWEPFPCSPVSTYMNH